MNAPTLFTLDKLYDACTSYVHTLDGYTPLSINHLEDDVIVFCVEDRVIRVIGYNLDDDTVIVNDGQYDYSLQFFQPVSPIEVFQQLS